MLNDSCYTVLDAVKELCKAYESCRFTKDILEFAHLQDGWCWGEGKKFDGGFLVDVLSVLNKFEKQLDGFCLFPTISGRIQLEHELLGWSTSIKFCYYPDGYFSIYLHAVHFKSDNVIETEYCAERAYKIFGILKYIKKCDALYKKRLEKKARLNDPRY